MSPTGMSPPAPPKRSLRLHCSCTILVTNFQILNLVVQLSSIYDFGQSL